MWDLEWNSCTFCWLSHMQCIFSLLSYMQFHCFPINYSLECCWRWICGVHSPPWCQSLSQMDKVEALLSVCFKLGSSWVQKNGWRQASMICLSWGVKFFKLQWKLSMVSFTASLAHWKWMPPLVRWVNTSIMGLLWFHGHNKALEISIYYYQKQMSSSDFKSVGVDGWGMNIKTLEHTLNIWGSSRLLLDCWGCCF